MSLNMVEMYSCIMCVPADLINLHLDVQRYRRDRSACKLMLRNWDLETLAQAAALKAGVPKVDETEFQRLRHRIDKFGACAR